MPIVQQKPVTPSGRFYLKNKVELDTKRPEPSLTKGFTGKKAEMHTVELLQEDAVVATKGCIAKLISDDQLSMSLPLL